MKNSDIKKLLTEYSRLAKMSDKMLKGDIKFCELERFAQVVDSSKELVKETRRKLREGVIN